MKGSVSEASRHRWGTQRRGHIIGYEERKNYGVRRSRLARGEVRCDVCI